MMDRREIAAARGEDRRFDEDTMTYTLVRVEEYGCDETCLPDTYHQLRFKARAARSLQDFHSHCVRMEFRKRRTAECSQWRKDNPGKGFYVPGAFGKWHPTHYSDLNERIMLSDRYRVKNIDFDMEAAGVAASLGWCLCDFKPITVPAVFEVCPTCDGKGTHVNPSIDSNGIAGHEFAEDPEFAEAYMSGRYDVQCYGCRGRRVIGVPDHSHLTPEHMKLLSDRAVEEYDDRMEREAERRMGC